MPTIRTGAVMKKTITCVLMAMLPACADVLDAERARTIPKLTSRRRGWTAQ
jgi:hypothetical protein